MTGNWRETIVDSVPLISGAEGARRRADGALVVDVREADMIARTGIIPGAVIVRKSDIARAFDTSDPQSLAGAGHTEREIVVYCVREPGSRAVVQKLLALGYQRSAHIEGGFEALHEAIAAA